MKGTLYSSDFVKNVNGELKLLELNTDTTFPSASLSHLNWDGFIEYLESESIDSVHVIHKQSIHDFLVANLSESLAGSTITNWDTTEELSTTIYPTDVQDSNNTFVLRMAYNESAIFDSEYCKSNKGLFKLYNDYTGSHMVVPHYISSSVDEYVINTLDPIENVSTVPDFVLKKESSMDVHLNFYKTQDTGATGQDKIELVISESYEDDDVLTNYINTSESGSYMNSYRSCNIICGNNLDYISVGMYKIPALFETPTQLTFQSTGSGDDIVNKVANKHRYEFATNWPKEFWKNQKGVHSEATLLTTGSEEIQAAATAVGGQYKSINIPGLPDTDNESLYYSWSLDGNSLPAETSHTSSMLVSKASQSVQYGVLTEISASDDSSFMLGSGLPVLCYDIAADKIKFEMATDLYTGSHQLIDASGSLVDIVENNLVVFEREEHTYELNMESDDVYIVNNSGVMLVAHNKNYGAGFYCFLAGAQIHTEFGDKNIEDIEVGDVVWAWDTENNEYTWSEVSEVHTGGTVGDSVDACRFLGKEKCGVFSIFIEDLDDDGEPNYLGFEFTAAHPFLTKDGWKALAPDATQEPWISEQADIKYLEVGDYIKWNDLSPTGKWVKIEEIKFRDVDPDTPVYNFKVPGTNTYQVNYTVVHNK